VSTGEHSPLPWRGQTSSPSHEALVDAEGKEIFSYTRNDDGLHFKPQDVALIVECVNSRKQLLAELARLNTELWRAGSRFNCMVLDKPALPNASEFASNAAYLMACNDAVDRHMVAAIEGKRRG